MTKKHQPQPATDVAVFKSANVRAFDLANAVAVAQTLAIDLTASIDDRASQAVAHANSSQRHMLAAGILLASIKAECEHGEFVALLAKRGFEARPAQQAMQYARFVLARNDVERAALLELPASKVMALASADPEVVEVLLEDGAETINALSVRALQQRVRELEATATDLAVQRDTAEAQTKDMRRRLARDRVDDVPVAVAALRAELLTLHTKARLSIESIRALGVDLVQLPGSDVGHEWADATMRMAVSALADLQLQLQGVQRQYLEAAPALLDQPMSPLMVLSPQEATELAGQLQTATAAHHLEADGRRREAENRRKDAEGERGRRLKVDAAAASASAKRKTYKANSK